MYADDTTICCIGNSVGEVILKLNKALEELVNWRKQNSLVPHPKKCEGMILNRKKFTGPFPSLHWVPHCRLLGITVDNWLTGAKHLSEPQKTMRDPKGFANKLRLLYVFYVFF